MATAPKTAFVFAGGGSLGAVQVGMLQAIVEHGVAADVVVGSSVGSINGAYFAGTPNLEGVNRLAGIWRGMRRRDVFPISWRTLASFPLKRDFLVRSEGVRRLAETHLPYRNLQDAKIPVHIVATDVLSGAPVILSEGSASLAILASTAIPAAFAPVKHGNLYLFDGAITSCTPVHVAVERGATRLIVMPTGFACARETPPKGAIANALHALTLLIARQTKSELEALSEEIDFHVAPPLCPLIGSPYDFSHTGELIDRAYKSTQSWIADGGLERREIPHEMESHKHH
jgi:NTE family protein